MARKILLADDSVTAQNMGRRILMDAGYEVTTVNNGSAALKKIAEQLPELIVLDVYMPGYSGLEVCQRLKETRETSRIPVLLTVGKLEPFKPEDARKARADAYIVKPFEASELLTALTKLEDKIVPQPASGKSGQFAKVWASLENSGPEGKTERFGDKETGWKDRLIIPVPGAKSEEAEPEEGQPAKAAKDAKKKGLKKDEKEKPSEPVVIAGVPTDITAEEVAAIAAAAAAFEEKSQPSASEFTVTGAEVPGEPAQNSATVPVAEVKTEAVAPASEPVVAKEAPVVPEAVAAVDAKAPEAAVVAEEKVAKPAQTKVEVPAASAAKEEIEAVAVPVVAEVKSSRWVAQTAPLEVHETNVILHEEMEKAYAVLRAATSEADFSPVAVMEPPVPVKVAEVPVPPAPVEARVEEAPKAEETQKVEPEPAPAPVAAVSEAKVEPEPAAAIAAAASAGASTPEISMPEVTSQVAPSVAPSAPAMEGKPVETELAAAWAQWKQIRESVVGSQLPAQIAEVAAAEIQDAPSENRAHAASAEEGTSAGNPTAIANIVDTVLAELKPKLMAEIAKKLGNDKK